MLTADFKITEETKKQNRTIKTKEKIMQKDEKKNRLKFGNLFELKSHFVLNISTFTQNDIWRIVKM